MEPILKLLLYVKMSIQINYFEMNNIGYIFLVRSTQMQY